MTPDNSLDDKDEFKNFELGKPLLLFLPDYVWGAIAPLPEVYIAESVVDPVFPSETFRRGVQKWR